MAKPTAKAAKHLKALGLNTKRQVERRLPSGPMGADITADGKVVYAGCIDTTVMRVDMKTGKHEQIGKHDSYVSTVKLIEERNMLITGGYDGVIRWYDLKQKKLIRKVKAHEFWSWRMAVSPDLKTVASATGQYLSGGYKYEPAAEKEPSVKLFDFESGKLLHSLSHVPSVQSVAISPDSKYVAAGNLMGEVRVWEIKSGKLLATMKTKDFTSWGIIKSHCYIGGVFDLMFTPNSREVILTGMGPMRDPMAGNGTQRWQKFAWQGKTPKKTGQNNDKEAGTGLMETLGMHPSGRGFMMAGRLFKGGWNAALFDTATGRKLASMNTGLRNTCARFTADGKKLMVAGTYGGKPKNGRMPPYGRVDLYDVRT